MTTQLLRQLPFFSHLDDGKINAVLKACETRKFKKDDVLMHQGDETDGMYVIISGEVEIEIDEKVVTSLEANDFLGEMALVAHEPRSATVRVVSDDLSTLFLSKETFEIIEDELGEDVKQEMLQRIIENYEEDFSS